MKLTITLTAEQAAKLEAIAASRRTTVAHLARELVPTYLAAVAQSLAPSVPATRRKLRLVPR